MVSTPTAPVERRTHVRFAASELHGLHAARVKYGPDIDVIDLSSGGVLFETAAPLTAESTIVLEFAGPTRTELIPSRIVRCQRVMTTDYRARSQGACVFRRPLRLKDLVTGITPSRAETLKTADDTAGPWQSVVAKYRDGRLISGYTSDFNPSKTHLHVSPAPSARDAQYLELNDLDAIFFLRDARDPGDAVAPPRRDDTYGRKVSLFLPNGDELTGSTLNYNRHASGVFMYPFASDFGVTRVFVTQGGIRNLRLL
jgi:hypothetical protein